MKITREAGKYVLYKEKTVIGTAALEDGRLWVEIDPGLAAAGVRQLSGQGDLAAKRRV